MSISSLQTNVETLILESGLRPDKRMKCSILRTLKMRHNDLDIKIAKRVIHSSLQALL